MTNELDDHRPEDKATQAEVLPMEGDPEYMHDPEHLETGTPQEEFDRMWQEGDTITEDGYLTERRP